MTFAVPEKWYKTGMEDKKYLVGRGEVDTEKYGDIRVCLTKLIPGNSRFKATGNSENHCS